MAILLHPFRLQLLPLLLFSPPFLANILQGIREVKDALFIEFLLLGDPTIFILVEIKKKRKKLQTHKCFSQKSVDNYLFHPSLNLLTFLEKFMEMLYIIFRKVEKQPSTAVTVLSEAYEESRPAKKPNRPPRRGAR